MATITATGSAGSTARLVATASASRSGQTITVTVSWTHSGENYAGWACLGTDDSTGEVDRHVSSSVYWEDYSNSGTKTFTFTSWGAYEYSIPIYVHTQDQQGGANVAASGTLSGTVPAATFSVGYNANGGTGAPSGQTKTYGVALTLRTGKPTRASASAGSYTVTYRINYTGGTDPAAASAARTTSYSFSKWNTKSDGSGTDYSPGGSYTANAAATMYAQWTSSTTTAAVTLPAPTRTGYTFQGWATSSTAASGVTGSYTPTGNVTLYAIWKANTYTVSYNANGGTGAPSSQTKTYGVTLTLSTTRPTRANASAGSYTVTYDGNGGTPGVRSASAARTTSYSFSKWNTASNGSGTNYSAGGSYTANAAATLYAQWTSSTTTAAVNLPTATRTGYTFRGWSTSASATTGVTGSYTPDGNVTLYAVWEAKSFTVTFNGNGGTAGQSSKSVTYDALYGTLPTATRTGYTFQGWYTAKSGGTQITAETTVSITANQTLYARWSANSYNVTFNANGGTVTPASKSVTYAGTYGSMPEPERSGYGFLGWYTAREGGDLVKSSTVMTTASNHSLYAHWGPMSILHLKQGADPVTVTQICAVQGGSVQRVTGVFSVSGGTVKRGI